MTLVLSSTSVATWLDCHLQWYFRYVAMLDAEPNEALRTGIATHEHVEDILNAKAHVVGRSVDPAVLDLVDTWIKHVRPDIGRPRFVEKPYRLVVNGIHYQSILDVVDEHNWVRDLKTTAKRPRPGRYRISLIGHALGFRALTGEMEAGRSLDYLVRTKTPYWWPERFEGAASPADVVEFGSTIEQVAEGIDRDQYHATGLDSPWACAMCPYKAICGPRRRYEEAR